jgi:uncharacterized membrane protein
MSNDIQELAQSLLAMNAKDLSEREKKVLNRIASRTRISENFSDTYSGQMTFGERVADRVATFGGSWTFILIFAAVIAIWCAGNILLSQEGYSFDPYPFIFLNLVLSMLAAIQAPLIMMSQNRQAATDRLAAGHDYEINLKAELEILALHEKMDDVRQAKLVRLMEQQEEQLVLLRKLTKS